MSIHYLSNLALKEAKFQGLIRPKGYWALPCCTVCFETVGKPALLHRWAMRLVFGWTWRQNES